MMSRQIIAALLLLALGTTVYSFPFATTAARPNAFLRSDYRSPSTPDAEGGMSRVYDETPIDVETSFYDTADALFKHQTFPTTEDPSMVEFLPSSRVKEAQDEEAARIQVDSSSMQYPFAVMMQGSAPYIAAHAGTVAVFHIPGELLESDASEHLLADIALSRLLGMKIVLVVGCRYDEDSCDINSEYSHVCHNALTVTGDKSLRAFEEEAGYVRTEVERRLNKCLHLDGGGEGNVVSGNFFSAQPFGKIRGQDFEHTGFTSNVHTQQIQHILANDDVVLLTTVGVSSLGELVNVNSYHLAASVASALGANKLIFFSNEGCVLRKKGDDSAIQDIPLSFAQAITRHHQVDVHNTGFATFEKARQEHDPAAVELLLHLGWGSWALQNGVTRAHFVNPGDGALLEELFTSKNGVNTCLFHDNEGGEESEDELLQEDWDAFFAASAAQTQGSSKATFE